MNSPMTLGDLDKLPPEDRVALQFKTWLRQLAYNLKAIRTALDCGAIAEIPPNLSPVDYLGLVETAFKDVIRREVHLAYREGVKRGREDERRYWEDILRRP